MTKALVLLFSLVLLGPGPLQAAPLEREDAAAFVRGFLKWYLPLALARGADAVLDPRMDPVIEPALLREWRTEQKAGEGGIGAVPFVGQDFDEGWARRFSVEEVDLAADPVTVDVLYRGKFMNQRVRLLLKPGPGKGWWICGEDEPGQGRGARR